MRLATWNVNSVQARLPRLLGWLEETRPDVLCLQETKASDDGFPVKEVAELGYEAALHGTGRWNGVAILSRAGLDDVRRGFPGEPGFPDPEARAISATCAGVRVWSVYVPNGRALDSPHLAYKLSWLAALREALAAELSPDGPGAGGPGADGRGVDGGGTRLAVCGDFNIAPRDDDVWDPAAFIGSTHVTPEERAALAALLDLGLTDVPARALKGEPFTYWDYRAGMFHKGMGMRIDLVLASGPVAAAVKDAYVDREARKGKGPSDHAPIVVDLDLPAAG
ncbi:MAG TPA: exodeoxyribonuclease III [Streptosporangiaceae bacterium]|jgi:exodeoxyribonuclease-3|nr:exodeoxyribonuclease III [Streptosporangiaceae bacterium]